MRTSFQVEPSGRACAGRCQLELRVSVGLIPQTRAREEHPRFKARVCHFCPTSHHEDLYEKGSVSKVNPG